MENIDQELVEICNRAQEGLCIKDKWGECPYPETLADNFDKCGLCVARYIIEKLGYSKSPCENCTYKKVALGYSQMID